MHKTLQYNNNNQKWSFWNGMELQAWNTQPILGSAYIFPLHLANKKLHMSIYCCQHDPPAKLQTILFQITCSIYSINNHLSFFTDHLDVTKDRLCSLLAWIRHNLVYLPIHKTWEKAEHQSPLELHEEQKCMYIFFLKCFNILDNDFFLKI